MKFFKASKMSDVKITPLICLCSFSLAWPDNKLSLVSMRNIESNNIMDGKKIIFPKIQNKCLPETQTIALQAESEFIMVKERKLDSDHEVM